MTKDELKPLGSNVPPYLKQKGYSAAQTKQILHFANEMAKVRGTRIIYLDFVMVADGTIRENQMGSPFVHQIRRAMRRQRGLGIPTSTGKAVPPKGGVRRRKQRKKANPASE